MGCGAPRSSRGVLGAPRACPNTPRSGVSRQASESAIAGEKAEIRLLVFEVTIYIFSTPLLKIVFRGNQRPVSFPERF